MKEWDAKNQKKVLMFTDMSHRFDGMKESWQKTEIIYHKSEKIYFAHHPWPPWIFPTITNLKSKCTTLFLIQKNFILKSLQARVIIKAMMHQGQKDTLFWYFVSKFVHIFCEKKNVLLIEKIYRNSRVRGKFQITAQWCVFNNSSLLGIKMCQILTHKTKL